MKPTLLTIVVFVLIISNTNAQELIDATGNSIFRNPTTSGWTGTTNLTIAASSKQNSGLKLSYEADSNPRVGRLTLNNSWGGIYGDFAISLRNSSGTYERLRIGSTGHFDFFGGTSVFRNNNSTSEWTGTTAITLAAGASQQTGLKLSYEADSNPRVGRLTLNNSWGGIYGDFAISLRNSSGTYERFRILSNGNVGIGTSDPKNKLSVAGAIWAQEVKVSMTDAADWVFEEDYKLRSLEEVADFIDENKHLPDVPSADEFRANDLNVAEMDNTLLQKIEELTLYLIEQNKTIKELQSEVAELKNQ